MLIFTQKPILNYVCSNFSAGRCFCLEHVHAHTGTRVSALNFRFGVVRFGSVRIPVKRQHYFLCCATKLYLLLGSSVNENEKLCSYLVLLLMPAYWPFLTIKCNISIQINGLKYPQKLKQHRTTFLQTISKKRQPSL